MSHPAPPTEFPMDCAKDMARIVFNKEWHKQRTAALCALEVVRWAAGSFLDDDADDSIIPIGSAPIITTDEQAIEVASELVAIQGPLTDMLMSMAAQLAIYLLTKYFG